MHKPARADYGVDAPIAVRNMLIVCALGIISLITRVAGLWGKESRFARSTGRIQSPTRRQGGAGSRSTSCSTFS